MSTTVKIDQRTMKGLIKQIPNGRIYKLEYYSKKDDTIVSRLARNGVTKFLKGTGKPVPDSETGLVTYYDCGRKNYRSPREENLKGFKYQGISYKVR